MYGYGITFIRGLRSACTALRHVRVVGIELHSSVVYVACQHRLEASTCKNMTATADLSSPWVGASPPAVLRSKNGARIYKHHMKNCRADSFKPRFGILGVDLYRKSF